MARPFSHVWKAGDESNITPDDFEPFVDALSERFEALNGRDYSIYALAKNGTAKNYKVPEDGDFSQTISSAHFAVNRTRALNFALIQRELLRLSTLFAKRTADPRDALLILNSSAIDGRKIDFERECESGEDITNSASAEVLTQLAFPSINFTARDPDGDVLGIRYFSWPAPHGFKRVVERWIYKTKMPGKPGQIARFLVRRPDQEGAIQGWFAPRFFWENEDKFFLGGYPEAPYTQPAPTPEAERIHGGRLFRFVAGPGDLGGLWTIIPEAEVKAEGLEPNDFIKYGCAQDGDIFGHWIPNEIRAAIKMLRRTIIVADSWRPEANTGGGYYQSFLRGRRADAGTIPPNAAGGNNPSKFNEDGTKIILSWTPRRGSKRYDIIRMSPGSAAEVVVGSRAASVYMVLYTLEVPYVAGASYFLKSINAAGATGLQRFKLPGEPGAGGNFEGTFLNEYPVAPAIWWDARGQKSEINSEAYWHRLKGYYNGDPIMTRYAAPNQGMRLGQFEKDVLSQKIFWAMGNAIDAFGTNRDTEDRVSPDEWGTIKAVADRRGSLTDPINPPADNHDMAFPPWVIWESFPSYPARFKIFRSRAYPAFFNLGRTGKDRRVMFYVMANQFSRHTPVNSFPVTDPSNTFGERFSDDEFRLIDQVVTSKDWDFGTSIDPLSPPDPPTVSHAEIMNVFQLVYDWMKYRFDHGADDQDLIDDASDALSALFAKARGESYAQHYAAAVDWSGSFSDD